MLSGLNSEFRSGFQKLLGLLKGDVLFEKFLCELKCMFGENFSCEFEVCVFGVFLLLSVCKI